LIFPKKAVKKPKIIKGVMIGATIKFEIGEMKEICLK